MPKKSQIERGQTMQWTNEKEQKHKRLLTMLLNYLCSHRALLIEQRNYSNQKCYYKYGQNEPTEKHKRHMIEPTEHRHIEKENCR
jgi:hypothetical protein